MKSTDNKMWDVINQRLLDLSYDEFHIEFPELRLLTSIITQAGIDHDDDYFKDDTFDYHCSLLRLSTDGVYKVIKHAWSIENRSKARAAA